MEFIKIILIVSIIILIIALTLKIIISIKNTIEIKKYEKETKIENYQIEEETNENFCPLISNNSEKKPCDHNCEFWSYYYGKCKLKNDFEEKNLKIVDGIKIAIGFSIWSFIISVVIFFIFWFIIPMFNNIDNNNCYENPITGEKKCY